MTNALATLDEPADHLGRLVAAFLAGRRSRLTAEAYARDLTSWLGWCHTNAVDPLDAWPAHIQLWLTHLAEQRREAGNTRARRLGAVSSWYGWLIRHQAAPRNPALLEREERPVRAPRKAPALSDQQTAALLAAADLDSRRAAAIVYLLLYTGIRVGELLGATTADLGEDRGHSVLHIRGKGGKLRVASLVPPVMLRLHAYLAERPDIAGTALVPAEQAGTGGPRPLVATANGRPLDRKEIRRLLRRLARKAGLPEVLADRISPHSARATFATSALDAGVPVRDVQYAMGHASPVTTEGYDRSTLSPDRSPAYRLLTRFGSGTVET
ncbi:tyrosine-type recombinase/integrase [Micromonospora andamanensis]|uniref:tyrosine-type recombinase/integrase n=1 Tax=Micromonospora andamanensis TaxID=1287068 RepID=UPI00194EF5CE|nr:tyrosine-type recombinase/integrase [Micromonospora andamanensis]